MVCTIYFSISTTTILYTGMFTASPLMDSHEGACAIEKRIDKLPSLARAFVLNFEDLAIKSGKESSGRNGKVMP